MNASIRVVSRKLLVVHKSWVGPYPRRLLAFLAA